MGAVHQFTSVVLQSGHVLYFIFIIICWIKNTVIIRFVYPYREEEENITQTYVTTYEIIIQMYDTN